MVLRPMIEVVSVYHSRGWWGRSRSQLRNQVRARSLSVPPRSAIPCLGVQTSCRKLESNLPALLKDLCVAGREVQGMLGREPWVELMRVLDVLELVEDPTDRSLKRHKPFFHMKSCASILTLTHMNQDFHVAIFCATTKTAKTFLVLIRGIAPMPQCPF